MNYRDFGFASDKSQTYQLFENIPVSANGITIKDLAKKMNITTYKVRLLISRLPSDVPVFEDLDRKIIGRIK
ncbi:MAG: hypothetical protein ACPKOI_05685 [Pleomorphochaeta sp.]